MRIAYANGADTEQKFIQNLALFLCTYLKEHGSLVEKDEFRSDLLTVSVNCACRMLLMVITSRLVRKHED